MSKAGQTLDEGDWQISLTNFAHPVTQRYSLIGQLVSPPHGSLQHAHCSAIRAVSTATALLFYAACRLVATCMKLVP